MRRGHPLLTRKALILLLLGPDWTEYKRLREELRGRTLYWDLKELEHLGLVESTYTRGLAPRRLLRLTEKGLQARELVKRLAELTGNTP